MSADFLSGLFSLTGRVALVTGASSGIGRELARGLAGAGATVALVGRSAERLKENRAWIVENGGEAATFIADLSDAAAVEPLLAAVEAELGTVSILVNNAGINQREPVLDVQPETYDRIMATNLRTPYFLAQGAARGMIANGGGKIINIGSLTTSWGGGNLSVYGMTKAAAGQMTRVMAVEWAEHNVQVNCICPGWIRTPLNEVLWTDPYKHHWLMDRVPAKRPGTPADLVGIAIYLASPAADFTTGQTFYIDGGFMAGGQW